MGILLLLVGVAVLAFGVSQHFKATRILAAPFKKTQRADDRHQSLASPSSRWAPCAAHGGLEALRAQNSGEAVQKSSSEWHRHQLTY